MIYIVAFIMINVWKRFDQCSTWVNSWSWILCFFVVIAIHIICYKNCLFLLKCTSVPIAVLKKVSKSRWMIDYRAFISDSLCTSIAQVNMQEPWKIFSFDLFSQNSYFMDEIFYRNVLACSLLWIQEKYWYI